jgi:murein DD-endopeptidase MepM/ murein hydrolase activator NlpD
VTVAPLLVMPSYRDGFGEPRPARSSSPTRHHAGIDLAAPYGAPVLAIGPGVIGALQGWDGPRAKASLLWLDDGRTVLYGAVLDRLPVGTRVAAGDVVATIGRYPRGSTMLHLELYDGHRRANTQWPWGEEKPSFLSNPYATLRGTVTPPGRRLARPQVRTRTDVVTVVGVAVTLGLGAWALTRPRPPTRSS